MQRFPVLESSLGCRVEEATSEAIDRLIEVGAEEGEQLDFKAKNYERDTDAKAELGKDVAAFANTTGGVILIGVTESSGHAVGKGPVEVSDAEVRRLRSVLLSWVHPYVPVDICRVPTREDAELGYFLIVVPRSVHEPHAVAEPNGADLRYWVRVGTQTRILSEAEVADRYRNRFATATYAVDRIHDVIEEAAPILDAERPLWMMAALAPASSGALDMSFGVDSRVGQWAKSRPSLPGWKALAEIVNWRVGRRRVEISGGDDASQRLATWSYAELHADGAGFAALQMIAFQYGLPEGPVPISDEGLVFNATALVDLLVAHAVENCGCYGEAQITSRLTGVGIGEPPVPAFRLTPLWHPLREFSNVYNARPVNLPTQWSSRTIDLDAAGASRTGMVATARLVATDVVQEFGLAEVLQFDSEGGLRLNYVSADMRDICQGWAQRNGIAINEDRVF
jgi:hypothetical protein